MPSYGEQLQELRKQKGMTQKQLADASGRPLGTLRNHEQSLRVIPSDDLFAYCRALGVECSAFANCTVKKSPPRKGR